MRIDHLISYGLHVTPDWINYTIIDDIIDSFQPVTKFIELETDTIDELVINAIDSERMNMLYRIAKVRKEVNMLIRNMSSKPELVKMVINRCVDQLGPEGETRLYLEDIHDHVLTIVAGLQHCEENLARSHSNYLAQISIQLTQTSNRTSDMVVKMTAVAGILVPLNVITGLWGMNVKVPGQGGDTLAWFYAIIFGMLCVFTVAVVALRKTKML